MASKSMFLIFLIALTMTALSCSMIRTTNDSSKPKLPADVLFQDDFSDRSSGWNQVSGTAGITDYVDGAYRVLIHLPSYEIWSNPGLDFSDTIITVEATKVDGPDDNYFGIICRYQDQKNFNFFIISSDGYYGIARMLDGEQELIGLESMNYSKNINQGAATNLLRADCGGKRLDFYVNDVLLMEENDTAFTSGDVGLIAGTFDTAGADIHFDHIMVKAP